MCVCVCVCFNVIEISEGGEIKDPRKHVNHTKTENLMERFSNRLDLVEGGISEMNTRSTEIIQNAVQRRTGRKRMK